MAKHILVVEDDQALARLLGDNLAYHGFVVQQVASAKECRQALEHWNPALVLLDLTLPDGDGLNICSMLTTRPDRPLIIILSARGAQNDKIRGLDMGADDYVTKPFSFEELLARMRAVMRRHNSSVDVVLLGDVVIDFRRLKATRNGRDLELSFRELEVLRFLAEHPSRPVSRDDLLHAVWGYREAPLTRSVDICIARLRRKIEIDPQKPQYIRTAHGNGYMLQLDHETN